MVPEFERRKLNGAVTELKKSRGIHQNREVKLREIHEEDYFSFLRNLAKLKGTLHAVATDGGVASDKEIAEHREHQANGVIRHKDRMITRKRSAIAAGPFRSGEKSFSPTLHSIAVPNHTRVGCSEIWCFVFCSEVSKISRELPVANRPEESNAYRIRKNLPHNDASDIAGHGSEGTNSDARRR